MNDCYPSPLYQEIANDSFSNSVHSLKFCGDPVELRRETMKEKAKEHCYHPWEYFLPERDRAPWYRIGSWAHHHPVTRSWRRLQHCLSTVHMLFVSSWESCFKGKKGRGDKTLKHQFTELSSKVCSISHSFPNIILAEIFCSWLSLKDGMFQFCWMLVLLEKSAIFLREHLTLLNTFSEVAWYKIQ